jgi:flagellar hook-length control protein FliK
MTNLPITSNNPQSTARGTPGVTPLPSPRPFEGRASGDAPSTGVLLNDPAAISGNVAPTSQAISAANDQAAEPFSVLLARQINGLALPALKSTQISAAIDSKAAASDTDPTAKNAQDPSIIAPSTSVDPTNTLVAMLQIPVQLTTYAPLNASLKSVPMSGTPLLRGDSSEDRGQDISAPLIKFAAGASKKIDGNLPQTSNKSAETNSALPATDNSKQADHPTSPIPQSSSALLPVSSDVVKHVEIVVSLAGQPQPSQSNANTVSAAAISAVMPNIQTNNISASTTQTIATPIGNSAWADKFSQKIIWMSTQQNQIVELHLNPPDLGPLNVVMKISDNQLTVQFTSPHTAVRDAVENALPKLREVMADNNIMLGNATVSDQPPRDRSGQGFMNQGFGTPAQRETPYIASESNELSPATAQSVPTRRHIGMLDTFA